MVSPRSVLTQSLVLLLLAASGCASYTAPAPESDQWADEWKDRASRAAHGAAKGAQVAGETVGEAMGTAYHGITNGFEDPDAKAYGRYPKNYAEAIRKHMIYVEGIPRDASFRFGKPERGYLNKGILAGGGIAWQGYLVEVEIVREPLFESQRKAESFVARMRDGDVIEVLEAEYADALQWAERSGEEPPAARR